MDLFLFAVETTTKKKLIKLYPKKSLLELPSCEQVYNERCLLGGVDPPPNIISFLINALLS